MEKNVVAAEDIQLTIEQVAGLVGVSKPTIRHWEKKFDIFPFRNGANHRRYSPEDLHLIRRVKQLYYNEGLKAADIKKILRAPA